MVQQVYAKGSSLTKRIIYFFYQAPDSQPKAEGQTIIQSVVLTAMLEIYMKFPPDSTLALHFIPRGKQFFFFFF